MKHNRKLSTYFVSFFHAQIRCVYSRFPFEKRHDCTMSICEVSKESFRIIIVRIEKKVLLHIQKNTLIFGLWKIYDWWCNHFNGYVICQIFLVLKIFLSSLKEFVSVFNSKCGYVICSVASELSSARFSLDPARAGRFQFGSYYF